MTSSANATEILSMTLQALSDAAVPDHLQAVAFTKVFDLLAVGAPTPIGKKTPGAAPPARQNSTIGSTHGGASDGLDGLDALAAKLGVDAEAVSELFHIGDDNKVELMVPTKSLDKTKSKAMAQVALLVSAARQGAGLDGEWTSVNDIRGVCEHYNVLDKSNFAGVMKGLDSHFSVRGSGMKRELKLKRTGWDKASEVVQQLASLE